jgi:hypothetical protein
MAALKKLLVKKNVLLTYGKPICSSQQGNKLIFNELSYNKPLMVCRLGYTELSTLSYYLFSRKKSRQPYADSIRNSISTYSGFFPTDDVSLDAFCELYLNDLKNVDMIGVWFNPHEDFVCRHFCKQAALVPLISLEPYYFANPWSVALSGKKVLVVHPFTQSIESQFRKSREYLFNKKTVLPDFDLTTIRAVQTLADTKSPHDSWFDALDSMKAQISNTDFDIALIGAGAYGLPLASYVKSLGKKAIHMGGATQILFGIKGNRWDNHKFISGLYNDHWIRPSKSEIITNAKQIENGCYW